MKFIFILLLASVNLLFAAGTKEFFDRVKQNCDVLHMYNFCHITAVAYRNGDGVNKSMSNAVKYYKKACNKKVGRACFDLGLLYEDGVQLRKNLNSAKYYYKKGCEFGNDISCDKFKSLQKKLSKKSSIKKSTDSSDIVPVIVKNNVKCDNIFEGTVLRYNKGYRFYQEFEAGDRDIFMNRYNVYFENPQYLDQGSKFDWTQDLKNRKYRIKANSSMRIFSTGKVPWRIAKHPKRRTNATVESHDFVIKYKVDYDYSDTPKDRSDDKTVVDCKYYSVSWCGDGIVDKKYEECEPKVNGKSCNPKTCKFY